MLKNIGKLLLVMVVAIGTTTVWSSSASAATPPDSCFDFNSGTGTINDYYDNEGNNGANPACTRDVDIPSTIGGNPVLVIGDIAFNSNDLTSVTIPNSVTAVGDGAFAGNLLASVTIPNSVVSIGQAAFQANNLSSITLGNSVASISGSAFTENQLTSVTIPDSVVSIGDNAFSRNVLTDVATGNGVTTIGTMAFAMNQFTSVTIPDSVTTLGEGAFGMNNPTYSFSDSILGGGLVSLVEYTGSMTYVRLYTQSSSNPNSLSDEVYLESTVGADLNSDGDLDDSLGGHLINPAQVTISYTSSTGSELRSPEVLTGTGLNDYLVISNTTNDQSLYYRLSQTYSFSAPAIPSYTTPAATNLLLASISNTYTFVYDTAAAGSLAESGGWIMGTTGAAASILVGGIAFMRIRSGKYRLMKSSLGR